MNITESLRIALHSLGANKMRSGLTMLGIIIGVAAVIAMVSIGNGAKSQIEAQIASSRTKTSQGGNRSLTSMSLHRQGALGGVVC